MADHDLTLTALDPDVAWGPVLLSCSVCGPLGVFPDPYAAYVAHTRLGAAAAIMSEVVVRREATGRSLKSA